MQTASWSGRRAASSATPSPRSSMSDSRLERLAVVLVDYSTEVREGEIVLVEAPDFAAPLAREVCRRVLRAGGHPQPLVAIEGPEESLLANGSDRQLEWFNPIRRSELLEASARDVVRGVAGLRLPRRLPRPGGSDRRVAALRGAARGDRGLARAAQRAADRRRGHGPDDRDSRPRLGPVLGPGQPPRRRGLHGTGRGRD